MCVVASRYIVRADTVAATSSGRRLATHISTGDRTAAIVGLVAQIMILAWTGIILYVATLHHTTQPRGRVAS